MTYPLNTLSIKFPIAPLIINERDTIDNFESIFLLISLIK